MESTEAASGAGAAATTAMRVARTEVVKRILAVGRGVGTLGYVCDCFGVVVAIVEQEDKRLMSNQGDARLLYSSLCPCVAAKPEELLNSHQPREFHP